jgi:molybdenum cofactor guanylyltransferase
MLSPQPVILAGGKSRRFGRDKLREPYGAGWLIDRPIAALRAVFGPCVAIVGDCDPAVAARADRHIPDRYPGQGPIGGILTVLELTNGDIFVLPGDGPAIAPSTIHAILVRADQSSDALAVLAQTSRIEPCIGLYRRGCAEALRAALAGTRALHSAIPAAHLVLVPIPPDQAVNINTPGDLVPPS